MIRTPHALFLALAIAGLCSPAVSTPQEVAAAATPRAAAVRTLDHYIADAFVYLGIDDIHAFGSDLEGLKISGLFSEPFVETLLEYLAAQGQFVMVTDWKSFESSELAAHIPDPGGLVQILQGIRGGIGFAVLDADNLEDQPGIAFGVDLGQGGERAVTWLSQALGKLAENEDIEFRVETRPAGTTFTLGKLGASEAPLEERAYIAIADDYLIATNERSALAGLFGNPLPRRLAGSAGFLEASSELRRAGGLFGYLDLQPIVGMILEGEGAGSEAGRALDVLGLMDMSYLSLSICPEGEAMRYRGRLRVEGGLPLLKSAFGSKRSFGTLAIAPANSLAAVSLSVRPQQMLDGMLAMVAAVDPGAHQEALEGMEFMREAAGIDIEADLIAEIGTEISIIAVPSSSPLPIPDVFVVLEMKDEGSVDRLAALLAALGGEEFESERVGRGRLFGIPEGTDDLEIEGFAAIGRHLAVALPIPLTQPRLALKRLLAAEGGQGSLTGHAGFRRATEHCALSRNGATFLYYLDWPGLAEVIYRPAKAFAPFAIEDEDVLELLPEAEVLERHLIPAAGLLRFDEKGIWYESCSVF